MKFIKVNMNDQTIKEESVPQEYIGLGGRGLTSIMINAEVPPKCDPLGPENKLISRKLMMKKGFMMITVKYVQNTVGICIRWLKPDLRSRDY